MLTASKLACLVESLVSEPHCDGWARDLRCNSGMNQACAAGLQGRAVQLDAASENAPVLVSLSEEGRLQVWDALKEACLASFEAPDTLCLVSWLPQSVIMT